MGGAAKKVTIWNPLWMIQWKRIINDTTSTTFHSTRQPTFRKPVVGTHRFLEPPVPDRRQSVRNSEKDGDHLVEVILLIRIDGLRYTDLADGDVVAPDVPAVRLDHGASVVPIGARFRVVPPGPLAPGTVIHVLVFVVRMVRIVRVVFVSPDVVVSG